MDLAVLTVNAGSTSLKLALVGSGGEARQFVDLDDARSVLAADPPAVVAHRVVHGGDRRAPVVVDDDVRAELEALVELAPLHQPAALRALDQARVHWPDAVQVACFDTAFHATLPAAAGTYALPARLRAKVRVVGFHGLSHARAAAVARELAPDARRVLVAHLGGGASLCAVLAGRSVDTTMGFTPLDGLVMATRSGRIDPGALLWLARHTDEDLDHVLAHESGLLGLAGSGDVRELLRREQAGDDDAHLALEVYAHRFAAEAGSMVAALGGLDVLVLTGGVGEHDGPMHARLLSRLAWLGVSVLPDGQAVRLPLEAGDVVRELTDPGAGGAVRVFVLPAREDLQLAAEARRVLSLG